jgi:hypothetical protein
LRRRWKIANGPQFMLTAQPLPGSFVTAAAAAPTVGADVGPDVGPKVDSPSTFIIMLC